MIQNLYAVTSIQVFDFILVIAEEFHFSDSVSSEMTALQQTI